MNSIFKIVEGSDQLKTNGFELLAGSSDTITPFQTGAFFDFFSDQADTEPLAFAVTENDKILVSAVCIILHEPGIKKTFTRRAVIYGGPVIRKESRNTEKALGLLLAHITGVLKSKKVIYVETRNLNDYSRYSDIFTGYGFSYSRHVNFILDINDIDKTFSGFSGEKRRQIRKSLKSGVSIKVAENENEVECLYLILYDLYKNKVRKPLPGLSYFLGLFRMFSENKNGFIALLVYNNEIIGGAFCPHTETTVYDWYRCGADNNYPKLYPSTLAVYAGILTANALGIRAYDFMGAGERDIPYGVRDFKAQFGGVMIEHGRFLKILRPVLFMIGKTGLKILYRKKKK